MLCGGDVPIRSLADNSSSFNGDPFSFTAEDSLAHASYPSQTDSFEICEGATSPYGSGGYDLANPYVCSEIHASDPYEAARSLTDRAWRSAHNEEYMDLLRRLVTGPNQQLRDVLRAIFEIGISRPAGSDGQWDAVSTLVSALALAHQHGEQEVASTIEEYIRNLDYDLHITFDQGPDHSGPGVITYNISGPVVPAAEIDPPQQEQPPQPEDTPPPVQRERPRRRQQVATEEQLPPADDPSEPELTLAVPIQDPQPLVPQLVLETGPAEPAVSGDPLRLGYATFEAVFGETLDDERAQFLAERAQRRHIEHPEREQYAQTARPLFPGGPSVAGCSESGDDLESEINIPQPHQMPPADAEPYAECEGIRDGFACRLIDPTIARHLSGSGDGEYQEREYVFHSQANGDYAYADPDGRNVMTIHPDGTMEDETDLPPPEVTLGAPLPDPVDGEGSGGLISVSTILPWDNPTLPLYMYDEIEAATSEARQRVAEETDMSYTREALDGLSVELLQIIKRHDDWSLAQQHDFLFQRWDECREDSVGNEARDTIIEFIRAHYRQGSSLGFTEEEMRAMNERRQTESTSFCPYGCPSDRDAPSVSAEATSGSLAEMTEPQRGENL